MRWKSVLPAILVATGLAVVTSMAVTSPVQNLSPPHAGGPVADDLLPMAQKVDQLLVAQLSAAGVTPAGKTDDLTVLRRLSLALLGTIPSLEEIRRFEADTRPDRLTIWTTVILSDTRFNDYFAERLARAYVGVEGGQFPIYRRDRFTNWIGQQLKDRTPYDQMVRRLIAEEGIPTDKAAVNFAVAGYANEEFDPNKLAGRTVRAFLGQRIDCAQCHDHPFDHWKQNEFEGLAASFGQLDLYPVGVVDNPDKKYEVVDETANASNEEGQPLKMRTVEPSVPFSPECYPSQGTPRERLAEWVTHPSNQRFERAIANRVWGLLFGQPYLSDQQPADRPVDDLPDPEDPRFKASTAVLDLLGADFRKHGCDLRRLIQVITSTAAYRRSSEHPLTDPLQLAQAERLWGVFPLSRLRPEQVIGAMLQSNSVKTIDQNSHLFARAFRYFRQDNYVKEFGDPGEAELEQHTATIPQTLLNLNGEFAKEMSQVGAFATPGTLRQFSPTNEALLDNAFLTCLTRRPTAAERTHFVEQLAKQPQDTEDAVMEDLFWTLYNAPEFTWNH